MPRSHSPHLAEESVREARPPLGSQHCGEEAEAAREAGLLPGRTDEHASKVTLDPRAGYARTGDASFKKKQKQKQTNPAMGGPVYRFESFALLVSWCAYERNTV